MLCHSDVVFLSLIVYQCSSQSLVRVGGGTKSFVCSFKVLSYFFFCIEQIKLFILLS